MLRYVLKFLSTNYGQQVVLLHNSQYGLRIAVYSLSFKPYMYSAIAVCSVCFLLTFSYWIYTKKVDKYDKIEDKQRRNKNDRKEKQ